MPSLSLPSPPIVTPKLLGILNVTPDSFSDGGLYENAEDAFLRAQELLRQGASGLDIGGDSTRPGSSCVGVGEEWSRIHLLVQRLVNEQIAGRDTNQILSIDTHHSEVALRALQIGANFINDVAAGNDPNMFSVVADFDVPICLMFSRCSTPHVFDEIDSSQILAQMREFFSQRIEAALKSGVKADQIILDPGMGAFLSSFPDASWTVLNHLEEILDLGFPVLLGISRKGFIGTVVPKTYTIQREEKDALSAMIGGMLQKRLMERGISYLRVHNPAIHKITFSVVQALNNGN